MTTTDLYRWPRTPHEEWRLQDLTEQLIASGTVIPDDPADGGRPPAPARPAPAAAARSSAHVSRVHPHPDNIRSEIGDIEESAASIMAHGILQPLTVEPMPGMPGHWRVIAGHRRLAAAKAAGLQAVPITVREPDGAEPEALMLIENCHRRDLPVMDKAEAMGALKSKGYSVDKIASSTGFAEATVYSYTALLDLDARTRAMVRDGRLPAADALAGVRAARKRQRKKTGKARRRAALGARPLHQLPPARPQGPGAVRRPRVHRPPPRGQGRVRPVLGDRHPPGRAHRRGGARRQPVGGADDARQPERGRDGGGTRRHDDRSGGRRARHPAR
jgi:ParB/RepB/Spo0J family partition protein